MKKHERIINMFRKIEPGNRYNYSLTLWNYEYDSLSAAEFNFLSRYIRLFC